MSLWKNTVEVRLDSLDDLVADQDTVLQGIEDIYRLQTTLVLSPSPLPGHKLTVVISGPEGEYSAKDILGGFSDTYHSHFASKHEEADKGTAIGRALRSLYSKQGLKRSILWHGGTGTSATVGVMADEPLIAAGMAALLQGTAIFDRYCREADEPVIYDNLERATIIIEPTQEETV